MNFLISKGVENKMSFDIMENVRKGKGLKPEWEQAMLAHEMCPSGPLTVAKRSNTCFRAGHAVAYVTMGLRVACVQSVSAACLLRGVFHHPCRRV